MKSGGPQREFLDENRGAPRGTPFGCPLSRARVGVGHIGPLRASSGRLLFPPSPRSPRPAPSSSSLLVPLTPPASSSSSLPLIPPPSSSSSLLVLIPLVLLPLPPPSSLLDPSIPGSLDPSIPRSLDPWIPRSLGPWIPRSLGPWIPGSLDPWIPGSLDPWIPATRGVAAFCLLRFGQFLFGATPCPARVVLAISLCALARSRHAPAASPSGRGGEGAPPPSPRESRRSWARGRPPGPCVARTSLRFAVIGSGLSSLAQRLPRAWRPRNSAPRVRARCPAARRWLGRAVWRGGYPSAIAMRFRAVRGVSGFPPPPGAARASPRFAVIGLAQGKGEGGLRRGPLRLPLLGGGRNRQRRPMATSPWIRSARCGRRFDPAVPCPEVEGEAERPTANQVEEGFRAGMEEGGGAQGAAEARGEPDGG